MYVVRSQSSPSAYLSVLGQDTEPLMALIESGSPQMHCMNMCVNGNNLYFKVLLVVIKTSTALYKYTPFTIHVLHLYVVL